MASMLDVAVYSSLRPATTTTATKSAAKLEEEEDDELIFDQYEEEVTEEEEESVVAKEQIEEKSNDDELEYLTNSLIMFIVDSRQQPIQGRSILTVCHKPSYLFDRFVTKLTAEAFALSGGDYSMSLLPLDYNCPKSSQCETARRLKSKIEKCMQEHSNVLTRVARQRQRTTTRRRSSIIKKPQQQPSIEQQQQQKHHHEQKDDHNESQSYHGYGTTTSLTTTSTTLKTKTKKFSYTQPHPVSSDIDYEDVERRSYHHHHQSDCQFLRFLDGPVLDVKATSNKSSVSFSSSTQIVIDVYLLAECCYLDLLTSTSSSHHSRHLSSNNSSCSISCCDLSSILNHPPLLLIQPFNSISNTTTTTTSSLQSDCSGASQCSTSTYSLPSSTFELLERWTISMITSKKNDDNSTQSSTTAANSAKSLLKVNELFQAIRSYLHFSQISSWISQQPSGSGQQQLPPVKNIAYSISWRQTNENDLTTTTATRISEEKKSNDDCTSISGTVNDEETIKPSQPLPSAEFDAQTFPILNLLFANNKLVLSQQQQQQQSQSQSQSSRVKSSLAISQIRIDLESRKRSFFSNTTTLGIPSLVCLIHPPKPNEETLNLTTMNKTAPVPIQPTPSTMTSSSFWPSLLVSPDSPSTQTLTPGSYTTTTTTTNNSNHLEKECKNEAEKDEPRTPTTTTATSLLGLLTPVSTPSQKPSTSSLVLTTPTQFPGLITAAHLFASPPPQSAAASLQPPPTANSSFNISQSPKVLVSNHQLLMLTTADDMKHLNLTDQNNNRNNEANHNGDVNRLDKVNISAEKKAESQPVNGIKPQQQQININKRKQLHLNLNPPHNDCNINANVDISWPQPQQQTNGSHHHHHNHHYNHHYNNNHHHQTNDLNNMSHNNDKSSKSLRIDCSNVDNVDIDNNANVINMIKPTGEQEFVVAAATNQNRESSTTTNNNNKHLLLKKPEQESTNDVQTTQLCNRHHASTYSCFPSVVGDGDNSSNNSNCSSSSNKQPQPQQQQQPVKPKVINKSTRCYFQLSSSPAPLRKSGSSFDFDNTLKDPKSIKNALTLNNKCTNNIANNNAKQSTTNGDNSNSNSNNTTSSRQVIISAAEVEKETTSVAEKKTVAVEEENVDDRIIDSGEQNGDNENENHHHELSEYMIDDNSSVKTMKHQHNSSSSSQHRSLRDTMHKSSTIANLQFSYSNTNLASSMPITPNCLLGSFEESLLNGRMNPVGIVDGFYAEIGASGAFFPEHVTLPVYAAFYQVCEDVAASPYLGIINLNNLASKRGYRVPTKGTIQVTLFNPNKTVVKMFVVMYDLSDMPASHRTFLRQRTMYVPLKNSSSSINSGSSAIASNNDDEDDSSELKSYLRYLIHLRFSTSKSGKLYLHTNVKLIFARNKCEIDPRLARYEYKTFTEAPNHPKYSPKR